MFLFLLYASLFISQILSSQKFPIIAIYANAEPDNSEFYTADYITSNNVRWLEAAGAGVVVIHTWYDVSQIDEILSKVNGVLIQGGKREIDLTNRWEENAKYILRKAITFTENGNYFPVIGICQGFELIHAIISGTVDVLSQFNAWNEATPLILSDNIENSKMFSGISVEEKLMLEEENIAPQFHHKGINIDDFSKKGLDEFFLVTTYAKDKDGHIFIDTVEGKKYPIYATQYHPEKISFERQYDSIPTHIGAILQSQRIAQFFVEEARKNQNVIEAQDLIKYDYIDTMTEVKKLYYYQDAEPIMGEKSLSFLA